MVTVVHVFLTTVLVLVLTTVVKTACVIVDVVVSLSTIVLGVMLNCVLVWVSVAGVPMVVVLVVVTMAGMIIEMVVVELTTLVFTSDDVKMSSSTIVLVDTVLNVTNDGWTEPADDVITFVLTWHKTGMEMAHSAKPFSCELAL